MKNTNIVDADMFTYLAMDTHATQSIVNANPGGFVGWQEERIGAARAMGNAATDAAYLYTMYQSAVAGAGIDWSAGTAVNRLDKGAGKVFKSQELLDAHYVKHGSEIQKVLGKSSYSSADYLGDANYIVNNGVYASELNGYVRFMSGQKYGFVGLDRVTGEITTFHIKTVSEVSKNAPSLGFGK